MVESCPTGRLLFNARDQNGSSKATRLTTISKDGGESFANPYRPEEPTRRPVCQGSLLSVEQGGKPWIDFSGPGTWKEPAGRCICG